MRIIFKIALFFTLFGISAVLLSQSKQFLKAEECYLEGKYEKALIKIEKSKKDKVQAKEPNTYLLESKILLGLNSLEPSAQLKKDAVKAAIKAKTKAKNNQQFISENQDHYKRISQINLNDALNFYNDKRYSKAIVLFKRSLELANDSFAQFMLGKCYLLNRSYRNALPIFDELLNKQYAHFVRSNVKADFLPDAFNLYTKTLSQKGLHDSAEFYLSMGLDMFPDDAGLLAIQKKVWYQQITEFPLSYQLFDFLDRATQTYPFDSIFTFKKNGVYLVFISNNVNAKDEIAADSWVNKLIREKVNLGSMNPTLNQKRQDYFLERDSNIILEKLVFYFGNFKEVVAQNYIFKSYKRSKFNNSTIAALAHLQTIFPANIVSSIYKHEIDESKNRELITQRFNWYQSLLLVTNKKPSDFEALLAINREIRNRSNTKQLSMDYANLLTNYWQLSIDSEDFWKAYELGFQADKLGLRTAKLLWSRTIEEDFVTNYYGTRILAHKPSTSSLGFEWNGSTENCNPGYLPDSILKKISKRINYFRRTARLPNPIGLMENYNRACQQAALFYATNNNLTHQLNPDLKCYSRAGAQAAKLGLLTQGVHTSIAITEFMNDNHTSAGNRRWLLYPPTQFMGFGCTDKQSVLQCVEDNIRWDTSEYISKGIAWPPAGYSPRLFGFKFWSYSGYLDFKGATIKMVDLNSGKGVNCAVQEISNGYGMPTIVWQPQELIRKGKGNANYQISITLKTGKMIKYKVSLLEVQI